MSFPVLSNELIQTMFVFYQLKDASVNDANATPPTTGMREDSIQKVGHSPRNRTENKTVKKGSIALIV